MKTRSFAVDLLLLASFFLSTGCAAPTPIPSPTASQTPPATETPTPAATQTPAPTATETPVPAEFIPLNVKSTKFSETKEGVTTTIVLSMDASMKMRVIDEKADEFVKNTNFPGGADEAMNAYARGFLYETAILTNENAKGMSEDEYLEALRFAQENPNDEKAWEKVEIKVYDDATKTTKNVRPTADLIIDFTYVNGGSTEGLTNINDERPNSGFRIEVDPNTNTLRMIRGLDNYGQENTARSPFVNDMIRRPSLLKNYKGMKMDINKTTESKKLKRCILVGNSGVSAFKLYFEGEPANTKEAQQNP